MSLSRRAVNFAGAAACALLIAYAYYTQYFLGFEPCPLCMFQRVAVFALGIVFLLAALHHPGALGARIYGALIGLIALAGIGVAARHVYIQSLPPGQVPACGAPLDFMLEVSPLFEVVHKVLTASGECGIVDWKFLGLAMPAWVLISCAALGVVGVVANLRAERRLPS